MCQALHRVNMGTNLRIGAGWTSNERGTPFAGENAPHIEGITVDIPELATRVVEQRQCWHEIPRFAPRNERAGGHACGHVGK